MKLPIHLSEIICLGVIVAVSIALTVRNTQLPVADSATPSGPQANVAMMEPDTAPVMPNFADYQNVTQRKHAFYAYMLPRIREANAEVMQQRQWLLDVAARLVGGQSLTSKELDRVHALEQHYGLASQGEVVAQVGKLLRHVDIVPASLVMAQAAKESGWGTSRFAVDGNNFFGIWCFSDGCGLRPARRDAGKTHEVARFDSVADGVRYYIRMLNSGPAYRELREIRANARRQHELAPGDELAQGLIRYSSRGVAYVKEIQNIIQHNNLHRFTIGHLEV